MHHALQHTHIAPAGCVLSSIQASYHSEFIDALGDQANIGILQTSLQHYHNQASFGAPARVLHRPSTLKCLFFPPGALLCAANPRAQAYRHVRLFCDALRAEHVSLFDFHRIFFLTIIGDVEPRCTLTALDMRNKCTLVFDPQFQIGRDGDAALLAKVRGIGACAVKCVLIANGFKCTFYHCNHFVRSRFVLQRALTLLTHEKRESERVDFSPADRDTWQQNRQLPNLSQQNLPAITQERAFSSGEQLAVSVLACLNVAASLCADERVTALTADTARGLAATAKRLLMAALEE